MYTPTSRLSRSRLSQCSALFEAEAAAADGAAPAAGRSLCMQPRLKRLGQQRSPALLGVQTKGADAASPSGGDSLEACKTVCKTVRMKWTVKHDSAIHPNDQQEFCGISILLPSIQI